MLWTKIDAAFDIQKDQSLQQLSLERKNVNNADLNLVTTAHLIIPNEAKTNLDIKKFVYYKYFSSGLFFIVLVLLLK